MKHIWKNMLKKRRWTITYQSEDSKGKVEFTGNCLICVQAIWRFLIRERYPWHRGDF